MGLNMVEDHINITAGMDETLFHKSSKNKNKVGSDFFIKFTNLQFDLYIFCNSLDSAFSVGDPVNARDLWLIVELQSDSRGRRTHLGKVCCPLLRNCILFCLPS